ncbi:hypothetical protein [Melittangium boletus]|uniref:hypothetical protein n=1 Tax=Melittangium boletus TaxID=83453 RepID=UPI003DA6ABA3
MSAKDREAPWRTALAVILVAWGWFEFLLILFWPESREMWRSGGGVLVGGFLVVVGPELLMCWHVVARNRGFYKPFLMALGGLVLGVTLGVLASRFGGTLAVKAPLEAFITRVLGWGLVRVFVYLGVCGAVLAVASSRERTAVKR